jgi:hypothetical protein
MMAAMSWLLLGVAAALAYAWTRIFAGYPRPSEPLRSLAAREIAFVDAAAEAMFPPGGEIPASGREAGVAHYADRWLASVPPQVRLLVHLLLFLVEHATIFFPAPGGVAGMRRFSSLDVAHRVAVLEGWQRSRFFPRRLVFTSLRAIMTMGYFSSPAVLRALDLAPRAIRSPVCEADLLYPRIGARPETIALTRADVGPPSDGTPLGPETPLHPAYASAASAPS